MSNLAEIVDLTPATDLIVDLTPEQRAALERVAMICAKHEREAGDLQAGLASVRRTLHAILWPRPRHTLTKGN